ncbi:hypothetical protein F5Y05DRAFT_407075 [Hypoxylon sp. FL0543]|nr:hypothetical protein F5Y05DRAFT_407075 [Hypoxylon sp. FL0543]
MATPTPTPPPDLSLPAKPVVVVPPAPDYYSLAIPRANHQLPRAVRGAPIPVYIPNSRAPPANGLGRPRRSDAPTSYSDEGGDSSDSAFQEDLSVYAVPLTKVPKTPRNEKLKKPAATAPPPTSPTSSAPTPSPASTDQPPPPQQPSPPLTHVSAATPLPETPPASCAIFDYFNELLDKHATSFTNDEQRALVSFLDASKPEQAPLVYRLATELPWEKRAHQLTISLAHWVVSQGGNDQLAADLLAQRLSHNDPSRWAELMSLAEVSELMDVQILLTDVRKAAKEVATDAEKAEWRARNLARDAWASLMELPL